MPSPISDAEVARAQATIAHVRRTLGPQLRRMADDHDQAAIAAGLAELMIGHVKHDGGSLDQAVSLVTMIWPHHTCPQCGN